MQQKKVKAKCFFADINRSKMKQLRLVAIFVLFSGNILLIGQAFKWTYTTETQTLRSGKEVVIQIRTNRFTGERQSRSGTDGWEDGVPVYD